MLRAILQPIQRTIQAILAGGRTGQILCKRSDADNDVEWVDPPSGAVDADQSLDITSTNAVSNQAVTESLTWRNIG